MEATLTAAIEGSGPEPADRREGFEALYRDNRDDVYAYVAGLLRDRAAAEDVTAQAFERALRRAASFDPRRGPRRAWLFGIARNAALDELRRRSRQTDLRVEPVAEEPVAEEPATEERTEAALGRAALQQALVGLGARERELVALKFFAGLGNAEIARVIGISESNVGTRLHRTLKKLREELR